MNSVAARNDRFCGAIQPSVEVNIGKKAVLEAAFFARMA
jgi:hypothetical protein